LSIKDLKALAKAFLAREGGVAGIVMAVAPTVVFFMVDALSSLQPALLAAVLTAVASLGVQLVRRRPLRQVIVGFVGVGASASVAAVTGQAKGFFLIGTVGGALFCAVLFVTVFVGRPLAGTVLDRVIGGRRDWRQDRRHLWVYSAITLVWAVQQVIWSALKAGFYLADLTGALAAMAVIGTPKVIVLFVGSAFVARRVIRRQPTPSPTG
jgi:hypothetical protein